VSIGVRRLQGSGAVKALERGLSGTGHAAYVEEGQEEDLAFRSLM
jgi:hypothetical protein